MPLGTPFSTNFAEGDVIYGLSTPREKYLATLPHGVASACKANGNYIYCDEFNNRTFLSLADDDKLHLKKNPMSAADLKGNEAAHFRKLSFKPRVWKGPTGEEILNSEQKKAMKDYYDALTGSRYSAKATAKSAQKGMVPGKKDMLPSSMIRRSCKFGLEYILLRKQKKVHFILDYFDRNTNTLEAINQDDVVAKLHRGSDPAPPITTSELRCCYRNRASWMATGRLKFYQNLVEVDAPWVLNPGIWQKYADYREQKAINATKL